MIFGYEIWMWKYVGESHFARTFFVISIMFKALFFTKITDKVSHLMTSIHGYNSFDNLTLLKFMPQNFHFKTFVWFKNFRPRHNIRNFRVFLDDVFNFTLVSSVFTVIFMKRCNVPAQTGFSCKLGITSSTFKGLFSLMNWCNVSF